MLNYRTQAPTCTTRNFLKKRRKFCIIQLKRFAKSERKGIVEYNNNPGPAQYSPKITENKKKCTIGNSIREVNSINTNTMPGPGQYEYKSKAVEG